jgi:3-carboxy-cis,cis-muconate cycloisomerase
VSVDILGEGWAAGTPVLPLLDAVRARLTADAAPHIHHRLTTQDVIDSSVMLLARASIADLSKLAVRCQDALQTSIERYRDRPTLARSFLQPASETTFGFRAGRWLTPLDAVIARADNARFPVQLGGLIGDRDGLSDAVCDAVAQRLGLDPAPQAWHTDRGPVIELVRVAADFARWAEKVAGDLALLASFGEVTMRGGGSTAAAGKQNPIDAMRAMAAAEACVGVSAIVTSGKPHELERGLGSWHAEWFAVPLVFMTAAAALEGSGGALSSLTVTKEA